MVSINGKIDIFLFAALFFNLSVFVKSQVGSRCTTPDGINGVCISVKECDPLLALLKTEVSNGNQIAVKFLRQSQCGVLGGTPLVCCAGLTLDQLISTSSSRPFVFPTSKPQTTTTTTTSTAITTEPQPVLKPKSSDIQLPVAPNCGSAKSTDGRIVGGVETRKGEFPWMAALGFRNAKNPTQPKWLCGGALITSRHVLTAAHCAVNQNLYIVRVGEHDLYDDDDGMEPIDLLIVNKKLHDDYIDGRYVNDIAILTLEKDAYGKNILPACLPISETMRSLSYTNNLGTVAGWGSIYFNGPSSAKLMKVMLPIVSQDECARAYRSVTGAVIDNRILCAGSSGDGKDSCKGDSGGPFMRAFTENHNGKVSAYYYLLGVVSYGIRCADPGYYGVYSSTSTFMDWIQENLKV